MARPLSIWLSRQPCTGASSPSPPPPPALRRLLRRRLLRELLRRPPGGPHRRLGLHVPLHEVLLGRVGLGGHAEGALPLLLHPERGQLPHEQLRPLRPRLGQPLLQDLLLPAAHGRPGLHDGRQLRPHDLRPPRRAAGGRRRRGRRAHEARLSYLCPSPPPPSRPPRVSLKVHILKKK